MNEVTITAPPAVPSAAPPALATRLIPVVTLLITAGMVAVVFATGSSLASNPMFLMFPAVLVVSALTSLAHGSGRQTAELNVARRRYLARLADIGLELSQDEAAQRLRLEDEHPDPDQLWLHARGARRWERHRGHECFGRIRVGRGQVAATARPVAVGEAEPAEVDPVTVDALHRLIARHSVVSDAPVTLDLRATALLRVGGEESAARAVVRAMLCQLATFHSPADVAIVVVAGAGRRRYWDWLKWLPHHGHSSLTDDLGPARLTFGTREAAATRGEDGRLTVAVFDGVDASAAEAGIWIAGPAVPSDLAMAQLDTMTELAAATCARSLAAHHGAAPDRTESGPLQVLLGTDELGAPVHLDINEAALGGGGPHGLCVGATGSGKSELLRTVAAGMIAGHTPEELNLVLVDFKGGATFLDFERAPHVSAVITNLADEAYLVDRMQDALSGEIHRRQQLLRAAGNLAGVADYARARSIRPELQALPSLFVIVDEFSELLSRHPDFIDQFVAIGRLGRSLGIHLLLASQRLDEGRLRGLESHLSYRICLKTLSIGESRTAIGISDAYQLPARPGAAYLKVGADDPVRFQAAHVSGPGARRNPRVENTPSRPMVFTCGAVGPVRSGASPENRPDRRVLDVVLDDAAAQGPAAHRVWLPPLVSSPALDTVLAAAQATGPMCVPVGLADRAFEQRLEPVILDLSGAAGNVAVVGAPRCGKSTALRTLALALSSRHRPDEVALYCLDFGGGALDALSGLPHVGVVATRRQPELVRRTVAHVAAVLRRRETSGESGDVFLVIDGWATVRTEFDDLEATVAAIAAEGLAYGVHVVLTASRWADIRPAVKDQIGTRIELRLGDPVDSDIDRARARVVPVNRPGSGLAPDGQPMMIAAPRLDGGRTEDGLTEQVEAAARMLAARHRGHRAPSVRMLPERFDYPDVPPALPLLGVDDELEPVTLDFGSHPHVLVTGEAGSGRSSLLRLLCREIRRTTDAELFVVDPRRALFDVGADGYAATPAQIGELSDRLATLLQVRLPGPDVPADQLRARSWFSGAGIHVIVDDQDLLGGGGAGNPLGALVDLLPHATDIGLHLVVAQRDSARTLYDPLAGALRDLGALTLQLNHTGDTRRPQPWHPGRALMRTRRGQKLIQVAWMAPTAPMPS